MIPVNTPPKEACLVWLHLANGKVEPGVYRSVHRKDGPQLCFIGQNGWLAMWRFGDDRVVSWSERFEEGHFREIDVGC
jgi:hypothetical protein